MSDFNDLREFSSLGEEFSGMFDELMRDVDQYSTKMSKRARKRIQDEYQDQISNLEAVMSSMGEVFETMEDSLDDVDRVAHQTFLTNRQRDLKKLERDYARRSREIERAQGDFFGTMQKEFATLSSEVADIASIMTSMDVAGIKDGLSEMSGSTLEMRHQIQATLGLTTAEYESFTADMLKRTEELSAAHGHVFSSTALLENTAAVVKELSVADREMAMALGEGLTVLGKTSDISGAGSYESLYRFISTFEGDYEQLIDTYNNLAVSGSRMGYATNASDFEETFNVFSDSVSRYADDAEEAQRRMVELAKMSAMVSDSFISAGNWSTMLKDIQSMTANDLESMTEKYMWALQGSGMSVLDLQDMLEAGDYGDVSLVILEGIERAFASSNSSLYSGMIKEALGMDSTDLNQIRKLTEQDADYFGKLYAEISDGYAESLETGSATAEALGDIHVSMLERFKNAVLSSQIGQTLNDFSEDLDLSLIDIYAGGQMLRMAGSAAGKIGERASLMGWGAKTGAGAAGLKSASFALPAVGASTLAVGGGLLGAGIGLGSAALSAEDASQALLWQSQETHANSAALKGTSVVAGAAIGMLAGPIGAAIGAGIGGIVGALGGDAAAGALQGVVDGSNKIRDSFEELREVELELANNLALERGFDDLRESYHAQYRELKLLEPGTADYEAELAKLNRVIAELNTVSPTMLSYEEDGITIKESSLAATESLIEAEANLARLRASTARREALNSAELLEEQMAKSVAASGDAAGVLDDMNSLMGQYEAMMSAGVSVGTREVMTNDGTTRREDYLVASNAEAQALLDAWNSSAKDLNRSAGMDGWFDNLSFMMSDVEYGAALFKKMGTEGYQNRAGDRIGEVGAAHSDAAMKQSEYEALYLQSINSLSDSMGRSLDSAAAGYSDMSTTDQALFKSLLLELDTINSTFDQISPDLMVDGDSFRSMLPDGSHKDGLWRVPKDGYRAILHRDEAVLPEEYADDWRSSIRSSRSMAELQNLLGYAEELDRTGRSFASMSPERLAALLGLNQYQSGSRSITEDQLALLHRGEQVITSAKVSEMQETEVETLREMLSTLKWGFDLLSKRLDSKDEFTAERRVSRTAETFRLGGVL